MDSEAAERIKELKDYLEVRQKELKDHLELRHKELKEHLEKHYATKVDLLTFREDVAIQFGKVHVEIAKLETTLIRWFIATAIAIAGASFGIARFIH
jgi:hypothetical protein